MVFLTPFWMFHVQIEYRIDWNKLVDAELYKLDKMRKVRSRPIRPPDLRTYTYGRHQSSTIEQPGNIDPHHRILR